jgi:hypothetical protein
VLTSTYRVHNSLSLLALLALLHGSPISLTQLWASLTKLLLIHETRSVTSVHCLKPVSAFNPKLNYSLLPVHFPKFPTFFFSGTTRVTNQRLMFRTMTERDKQDFTYKVPCRLVTSWLVASEVGVVTGRSARGLVLSSM